MALSEGRGRMAVSDGRSGVGDRVRDSGVRKAGLVMVEVADGGHG